MNAIALAPTGVPPRAGWAPCSDRSLERGDPLAGTGGYGERWFLVEIDGSWGAHAFLNSRLEPELARSLVRRIEDAGMRAARHPSDQSPRRRAPGPVRVAVGDHRHEARTGIHTLGFGG